MTARRRNAKISARGASELARWRKGDSELLLRSDGAILSKAFKGEPWKLWARTKTGDVARVDAALSKQGYARANPLLPPLFIPPNRSMAGAAVARGRRNPFTRDEVKAVTSRAKRALREGRRLGGTPGGWRNLGEVEALVDALEVGKAPGRLVAAVGSAGRDLWRQVASGTAAEEIRLRAERGRWRELPGGKMWGETYGAYIGRGRDKYILVRSPGTPYARTVTFQRLSELKPEYRALFRPPKPAAATPPSNPIRPAARAFVSRKIAALRREGYGAAQASAIAYSMARRAGHRVPPAPARRNPLLLAVGNPAVHFTDRGHHADPSSGYVTGTPKSVEILSPRPFKVTLTSPGGRQAKPRLARGVFAKDLDNPPAGKPRRRPSRTRHGRKRAADPRRAQAAPRGSRNPSSAGRAMDEAKARAWARAHGLERELDRAIRLQTVANRRPTVFRIARIPMGDAKKVQMRAVLAHYGTSPEDVYMPPRGSKKGSVMYRHEWGEGNRRAAGRSGVAVLAAPSGKALIKLMGPGQRITDWMRG